jgi:hypothetical protein
VIFNVVIDPGVLEDIQQAMNFYNKQEKGLGSKFESELNKHLNALRKILSFKFVMTMCVVFQ